MNLLSIRIDAIGLLLAFASGVALVFVAGSVGASSVSASAVTVIGAP